MTRKGHLAGPGGGPEIPPAARARIRVREHPVPSAGAAGTGGVRPGTAPPPRRSSTRPDGLSPGLVNYLFITGIAGKPRGHREFSCRGARSAKGEEEMVPVRDPQELYEFDPEGLEAADAVTGPAESGGLVLLYHLEGFMDAGQAGEQVIDHVRSELSHDVVARFDADRLVDYRARRPPMVFRRDRWASYQAPRLELLLVRDDTGSPFLLLSGPEPDVEWELFAAAVGDLVERLGVRLAVSFHGIPMAVPHTRPTGLTAHGSRKDLIAGHVSLFDEAEVPASAEALIEYRLSEAGHDVVGFAVHVPHYLAGSAYPPAAVSALEAITSATGLVLPAPALVAVGQQVREEIDRQVAADDEGGLASEIQSMEHRYDAVTGPKLRENLVAETSDLPSADELGAEFERFLADRDRDIDL